MITENLFLYDDRDDVVLTTYVLENSEEYRKGKPRPAVLICPGGAYINCSDREGEPVALRFLSMGYHVFVLRYSVYSENGNTPFGFDRMPEPKEKTAYPKPMLEVGKALSKIREHAAEWFVEKERIALCGFSAGAHNVAMYSCYWNAPIVKESIGGSDEMRKPNALILGYPLTDYLYMKKTIEDDPIQKGLFTMSNLAYMGTTAPSEQLLDEISPANHVSDDVPPTFIWATASDELVPVTNSLLMAQSLSKKKIPYELHIFETGQHGLATADQSSAEALSQVNKDAAKWIPLVKAWLEKRFAYNLPEKTAMEMFAPQQ